MWLVWIIVILLTLLFGICIGAFAMFAVLRHIQIRYARITEEDIGKDAWCVFMEQIDSI